VTAGEFATFGVGDRVCVHRDVPTGNPRTPRYVRGSCGVVIRAYGVLDNPQDHRDPYPPLYTVLFDVSDAVRDEVAVDLHADWLEFAPRGGNVCEPGFGPQ
jgi:hypothetical protein